MMSAGSKLYCRLRPALILLVGAVASSGLIGCEVPTPPPGHASKDAPPEPKYVEPGSKEEEQLRAALVEAGAPTTDDAAVPDDAGGDTRSIVTSRANEPVGFITTPINAYFSAGEQINHIQILDGLKIFRKLKGRRPRDFAEVEAEVLKPRGISLPALKIGESYIYDPDEGPDGDILIRSAKP